LDVFSEILEKYAKLMHSDYLRSRENIIVRERNRLYEKFYKAAYIPLVSQEKPVVFVDSGRLDLETDVSSLTIVNVGALIRNKEGELILPGDYLGDPEAPLAETIIVYSNIGAEKREGIDLSFKIIMEPIGYSLFFDERDPYKISSELSEKINRDLASSRIDTARKTRILKRIHNYITQLIEIGYLARIISRKPDCIGVVDGTLIRWLSVKGARISGYRILSTLSGLDDAVLEAHLDSIIGISKTSKFTTLARAFNLFNKYEKRENGAYGYVDSESARAAANVLMDIIAKLDVDAAEEASRIFNRIVFQDRGVWSFRIPVSGDFKQIFHAEYYTREPVLNMIHEGSKPTVKVNEKLAEHLAEKIHYTLPQVFAMRSNIPGLPPYGFMEVDREVRIDKHKAKIIYQSFLVKLHDITGREDHPLIQVFESTLKMRYGYR
jgi:hypothetical protein